MLSPHFSYEEMTRSAWADANGVENQPDELQLACMINLCWKLGEPLREIFSRAVIRSGFRTAEVNEGVHDVGASKHLSGEAVDIAISSPAQGREYFMFISKNIDFDQLLFEYNREDEVWLHCSVCLDPAQNRHMAIFNLRSEKYGL